MSNRVLRELIGERRPRLNDDQRRRLGAKGKLIGRRLLPEAASIVQPDTILRWHRRLIANKHDGSDRRKLGRPRVMQRIRELAVRMAIENERWGYTRIRDELRILGHVVSRSTVRRALKEHGIDPATERRKRMPWKRFLEAHWQSLAACDFFTVEVWTRAGLIRYAVFFVIDLPTRRVAIAGISPAADGFWMEQIARNLTDAFSGFLLHHGLLAHDRDPLYTSRFIEIAEYVEHYHVERCHRIGSRRIETPSCGFQKGPIERQKRLGGLLNHYRRTAA